MCTFSDTTAIVLAGGQGSRLRSVISDRPKVLAPVHGRPFIAYLLDQLAAAGIARVVICVGYLADEVIATFGGTYAGMALTYSREWTALGTGGAIGLALAAVPTDAVMVLNGDSYIDVDFAALRQWLDRRRPPLAMVVKQLPDTARYGRVELAADGQVLSFVEKGVSNGPGYINGGFYLASRGLLRSLPSSQPVSLERDWLPLHTDGRLYGWPTCGDFIDIGTPESFAATATFFSARHA